jgi:signal transduction histidine kinase/HAMP domain-containing protein/ActR/RegA family two-component response regulator
MPLSTRFIIAIVALVLATAGAVGYLTYRNLSAVAVPRALDRADAHARLLASDLANIVASARADVKGFRQVIGLDEIMALSLDPSLERVGGQTLAEWRTRIERRLVAELEAKPHYIVFRIITIAQGGRQILRVRRPATGGAARIVPASELETRGDRDYFKNTVSAPDGTIVVSPVELNRDDGVIEKPNVPVVRVSSPLFAPDGKLFGMIVLNVDLRPAFKRIDESSNVDTDIYVVNDRGDYLVHPDESREFGFQFGRSFRIQDDFPGLASAIANGAPTTSVLNDRNGKTFGIAVSSVKLSEGPRVSVVEAVPEDKIVAAAGAAIRQSSLIGGTIAVICAALLAIFLARNLTRPLTQMTSAVAKFDFETPLVVPLTASGEIGVLARAFEDMVRQMREKTAAIRHDKEIFETIMASMREAVLLLDTSGEVIFENAAAKLMLRPPPHIERPPWEEAFETYQPDGITPLPAEDWPSRRSLRGEIVDEYECVFRVLGTDTLRHVTGSAGPIRDATGKQTGAVVVFRDVSEAKELEHQLRQSQKLDAIGQLTGGIAHDFNNTLTVITGTIEILAEGVADRPDLYAIAKLIDQAADRGADLTKHLLAFARKQPLQPHNIDVNAMVIDAANLLRPTLGEHIEIDAKLADDADFAHIDSTQLSTALLNLAVNARDAMPNGGKLTLETGNVTLDEAYAQANSEVRPGPYVMIAVSDTGIGISPKIIDKVFEPFFTTKEIGKGTGLGLSMVYGFVKQSNGHIKIYSEEGHGTTIKLYLPRGTAKLDVILTPAPLAGGRETIFVVEDDDMVREFLVTQLHSLGYKTVTAASGVAALAKIDNGVAFDLLFTDVIMPGGINGRQLADEVAKRLPGMKVLYTSGYTENAIIHHGRLDAGVLLLAKPYRKADLARMLRLALGTPGIVQSTAPDSRTVATERRP